MELESRIFTSKEPQVYDPCSNRFIAQLSFLLQEMKITVFLHKIIVILDCQTPETVRLRAALRNFLKKNDSKN